MGELAVSRAFGDAELKKTVTELVGAAAAPADRRRRLVVAEPEVLFAESAPGDAFVLLGVQETPSISLRHDFVRVDASDCCV